MPCWQNQICGRNHSYLKIENFQEISKRICTYLALRITLKVCTYFMEWVTKNAREGNRHSHGCLCIFIEFAKKEYRDLLNPVINDSQFKWVLPFFFIYRVGKIKYAEGNIGFYCLKISKQFPSKIKKTIPNFLRLGKYFFI